MSADTYTPPETVTIPGEAAVEILATLEAFASVCADFRGERREEEHRFYNLQTAAYEPVAEALGHGNAHELDAPEWYDAMQERSRAIEVELRALLRGSDSLRLADLESAVEGLGCKLGIMWDQGKWLTPRAYFANLETTDAQ